MATVEMPEATTDQPPEHADLDADPRRTRDRRGRSTLDRWLAPLASLKLTVVLLTLSIFVVLVGTLAQTRADIWQVIDEYFRFDFGKLVTGSFPFVNLGELFVTVEGGLFPSAFGLTAPTWLDAIRFPFPKGWTLGILLMVNLLAAHLTRFKLQATGKRLWLGVGVTAFGLLVTWAVIASGDFAYGLQEERVVSFDLLWKLILASVAVIACACGYGAFTVGREEKPRTAERVMLGASAAGLLTLFFYLLSLGQDGRLEDAYMRILWQLIKATVAGVLLLIGCVILFRKRAGIVLLHAGVGLLMVGEILVGVQASEAQMSIEEGRANNYAEDSRAWEVAVIDQTAGDGASFEETVVAADAFEGGETVAVPGRGVSLRIREFFENSQIQRPSWDDDLVATDGVGTRAVIVPLKPGDGLTSSVDQPSAYVDVLDGSGDVLQTLLLASQLGPETVVVGGKPLQVDLRFKRDYKRYVVSLRDMQKQDYVGTDTVQDYSAFIALGDAESGLRRDGIRVYMNNPLRYAGETLYQSQYYPAGAFAAGRSKEITRLQIVSNRGWMIPYVACMIVAVGMLAQFGLGLLRFIDRRRTGRGRAERFVATEAVAEIPGQEPKASRATLITAASVVGLSALWVAWCATTPEPDEGRADVWSFAQTPVAEAGRVKPIDSYARDTLLRLSDRQSAMAPHWDPKKAAKDKTVTIQPTRWLLDTISGVPASEDYRVFRVEYPELLDILELPWRKKLTFSPKEIAANLDKLDVVADAAAAKEEEEWSLLERKAIDLRRKWNIYRMAQIAFAPITPSGDTFTGYLNDLREKKTELKRAKPPLAVPVEGEPAEPPNDPQWMSYGEASMLGQLERIIAEASEESPAPVANNIADYTRMILAWTDYAEAEDAFDTLARGENPDEEALAAAKADMANAAKVFDAEVAKWRQIVDRIDPAGYEPDTVGFEAFFNSFAPFDRAWILYIGVSVLALLSLVVAERPLRWTAFWLMTFAFVVHTFALWARIEISGRPPVTNLYTTAVFIGWAAVLLGIAIEAIFRQTFGLLVGGAAGVLTLRIAQVLETQGDTFSVMQAVLDTQFWLATHVVTVTLGYAATLFAGAVGCVYLIRHAVAYVKRDETFAAGDGRTLAKVTYGITCFAVLFSFVGTVLGGLWADDSWGRFWGWDPKENGALMIVLANAVVLHARWGKLVGDVGLCVLAVLSNCVVAWSWFGVNELGVGLHSYGFTEGVLRNLAIFAVTQAAVAGLGLLPRQTAGDPKFLGVRG